MVKAITVEEIQLVVPMSYGRRRTRRRIWDLPADTVEFDELKYPRAAEYLTEKSISFEVEMEAEEALFYGNSWMSDIECRAVTDWLKKFEDETLELFADALEKEVDHGKQFFRELVSGEVQDVTASGLMEVEADLKELIGGLQRKASPYPILILTKSITQSHGIQFNFSSLAYLCYSCWPLLVLKKQKG